jgi:hypothetical protein
MAPMTVAVNACWAMDLRVTETFSSILAGNYFVFAYNRVRTAVLKAGVISVQALRRLTHRIAAGIM